MRTHPSSYVSTLFGWLMFKEHEKTTILLGSADSFPNLNMGKLNKVKLEQAKVALLPPKAFGSGK